MREKGGKSKMAPKCRECENTEFQDMNGET